MNAVLAWFARHGVAANLLMGLIIIAGLLGLSRIRVQSVPKIEFNLISVNVAYPGASPEEIEEKICILIEDQIQNLRSLKRVRSVALEGRGYVTVELLDDADVRQALEDVKARVDLIDSFPVESEEPIVEEVVAPEQVLSFVVAGPTNTESLQRIGERLRNEVMTLAGVTQARVISGLPYEISVEVSETTLRRFGLTIDDIATAIRRSSMDVPGGSIKAREGEILMRTRGEAQYDHEIEKLILLTREDGVRLTIGDVATVLDSVVEVGRGTRFDGQPAVLIQVFRVGNQDVTDVVNRVKSFLEQARQRLPDNLQLSIWQDQTEDLRSRLGVLLANGRDGFLLVILVLATFLRMRTAGWVALGIPISFLGTLWIMPIFDQSINLTSLLGFIVVLGIVVDDALVVAESIHQHYDHGKEHVEAAISGVQEVAIPVVFSAMTTVAAFWPLTRIPGVLGQIMEIIPFVVILVILFSLIESLLVLPSHMTYLRRGNARYPWDRLQEWVTRAFERLVRRKYLPILEWVISWRLTTLAIGLVLLLVSFGMLAGGRLKFSFFPPVESNQIQIALTLPQGTAAEVTQETLIQIETSVRDVTAQLAQAGTTPIRHVLTTLGSHPTQGLRFTDPGRVTPSGSHLGEVSISLVPAEERDLSANEIAQLLRERIGPIPSAVELAFNTSLLEVGKAIDVRLASQDFDELRLAADDLKETLGTYPGVFGVVDSFRVGKQEIVLSMKSEAEAEGISLAELARQVRQAFYGEEVQQIQRNQDALKIMVRYPREERSQIASLEGMRLRTAQGAEIPFSAVAHASLGRGVAVIERTDRKRTVNVTANVDLASANSNEIVADLKLKVLPIMQLAHPGLSYSFAGEQQEQQEAVAELGRSTLMAFVLIYALVAVPFGSYLKPLIVLGAVPFGVIGAIWGHILMGHALTMNSMLGIVAMSGVVVNDSLVYVDLVNRLQSKGIPTFDAILQAGERRIRPIVLTSLTTFAGLMPLLLEESVQARFLIPMAISIAYGVLFATFITLILVPALTALVEDVKALLRP